MVHAVKHYVQYPISQIATGVREAIVIVHAVESTIANLATEVAEGSSIKAIYFELWLQNEGNLGEFIMTISKDPQDIQGPTFAQQANLFGYNNKKNVFYTTQGLTPNDGISGPINVIKGWVKIPKSKQRFGLGDSITMVISNVSANDLVRCGFSTYKEYN